jgi:hypothetical protein
MNCLHGNLVGMCPKCSKLGSSEAQPDALEAFHQTLSQMIQMCDRECAALRQVRSPQAVAAFDHFVELGQALSLARRAVERLKRGITS